MPRPIIDHVDIRVSDVDASRAFYAAALAPLGIQLEPEQADPAGGREIPFSREGNVVRSPLAGRRAGPGHRTTGAHIAFTAESRDEVQAFHAAAVATAAGTSATPARAASTAMATTARSSSTPTATTSRPSCGRTDGMAVTQIDHLVLDGRRSRATLAWYGYVAHASHHLRRRAPRAAVRRPEDQPARPGEEVEPHARQPTPGSADLCFIVDESPDQLQARLDALGMPVELGSVIRDGALGTLTSNYLRDPDGNLVELSCYT